MEIVKKNLFSIIFGVIAILAVLTLFWPISGLYGTLGKQLSDRISVGSSLAQLNNASRRMPLLSPDKTAPDPLPVYPRSEVINAGIAATGRVAKEADAMLQAAINANRHELMYPNILPKPDSTTCYDFVDVYQKQVTDYARWKDVIHIGWRPTPQEITEKLHDLHDQIVPKDLVDPQLRADAEAEYTTKARLKRDTIKLEHAQNCSVYMDPTLVQFDSQITVAQGHAPPTPEQIWDAHLQVWQLDDVFKAIARTNQLYADPAEPGGAPVNDVIHAPIKQIERIDRVTFQDSPNAGDAAAGLTSPTPKVLSVSFSGRVSNTMYCVERYHLTLLMDAAKIPIIIRELEVGQFITVLNVQVDGFEDLAQAQLQGFCYGGKPVARVELDCEELMMTGWLNDLIPDSRKHALGTAAANPAAVAGPPSGAVALPPGMPEAAQRAMEEAMKHIGPPGGQQGPPTH